MQIGIQTPLCCCCCCCAVPNPNPQQVIEIFETPDALYEVMELCVGGDIGTVLTAEPNMRFTEPRVRPLVGKMVRAVAYLHANNLVHRDLKLDNYIFTSKKAIAELKLIDFGLSRQYFEDEGEHMTRCTGTPAYMAPELIMNDYTESSDMWSLGVTIFVMVSGAFPFEWDDSVVRQKIVELSRDPAVVRQHIERQLQNNQMYGTFWLSFHRFDRFELDLRGHTQP